MKPKMLKRGWLLVALAALLVALAFPARARAKVEVSDPRVVADSTASAGNPAQKVSLGREHSAAIKADGSLWLWGANDFGQLGDGSTTDNKTPSKILDDVIAVSLSLDGDNSAAIKSDGTLWTWGYDYLGNGQGGTAFKTPTMVMEDVACVARGGTNSALIKDDGSLWVWGYNGHGGLGFPAESYDTEFVHSPVKVMDDTLAVAVGVYRTAAIKSDGTLWTWGNNSHGQLGDGTTTDSSTPLKVMEDVAAVSLGANHTAAIKKDGTLWVWGSNDQGQIGDGTKIDRTTPVKIMDDVASVSLGYNFSAAIKTDGSLWTWGSNSYKMDYNTMLYGMLGDGTKDDRLVPAKIMDGVTAISLGWCHAAAIKEDGTLWMWGSNMGTRGDGYLGGVVSGRYTLDPVQVLSGLIDNSGPGSPTPSDPDDPTPSDPDDPGTENDGIVWAAGYDFLDDSYSFENFIAWIPYGYWATLYESGAGKLFWKKQLQGGVCYGMSLTTASILSSQPGVGRFSYGGASHGRLRDLVLSSASYAYVGSGVMGSVALVNNNVGAITIDSYIKYAQIYQYSTEATDSEGWGWAANAGYNQMRQILTYVKGRIDEGGYVAISMYKTGSAHTVLAVGYEGDDIIIDDPNDSEGPRRLTVREDGTWTFNGPAAYSSDDEGSKLSVENYVRQDLALRPWQILSSGVASMSGADWALGKSEADAGDILVIGANTLDSDNALVKVEADSYQLDTPDVVALDNAAGTSEIEGEAGVDTTGMYWVLGANDVSVSGLEGDSCTVEVGADEALVSASVPGGSDVSVGIEGEDSHVEVASEEGGDVSLSFETTDGDGGDVVVTVSGTSLPGGAEAESEDGEYSFAGLSDVTFELESDGSKSEAHVDCPEGEGVVVMVEEGDGGEPELSVSKSIRQADVVVSGGSVYTGQPVEPLLAVTLDGAELLEGTDYTVAYEDNVNAGTATAKVTGIGTYAGAVTVQFEIAKSPQEVIASAKSVAMGKTVALGAKASGGGELTYKSSNAEVAKVGTGGKITPVNVGTAEVTVTAAETDNYESATKTVKVTVTKGTQAVTASGKSVQVKKTVKLAAKTSGDGKLTYKSSNTTVATVSAKGVVTGRRVGTAKITITAAETANYKSAKKTITVRVKYANPMTVKAKKATVAVSFSKLKTKAVTLASNVTVSKAKGKVTYANASTNATAKKFKVNAKTGKVTVPKGTKKGTYKVKIKVKAAGNTSYLSGSKTVTYKVRVK